MPLVEVEEEAGAGSHIWLVLRQAPSLLPFLSCQMLLKRVELRLQVPHSLQGLSARPSDGSSSVWDQPLLCAKYGDAKGQMWLTTNSS